MADNLDYNPVPHDHEAFLAKARKQPGFSEAYAERKVHYALVERMLRARSRAGLTQEAVAERMGTSKSAVSRLESGGKHAPSIATLERYANAVGCDLEIRFTRMKG